MVRIRQVTTGRGDRGTTVLGDGRRVPKTDARIEAAGAVDEANASIGLAMAMLGEAADGSHEALRGVLEAVQNDLFDLGADLAVPMAQDETARPRRRISGDHVRGLEETTQAWNQALEPLDSFVLPGGSVAAAHLHLARTIVRRAERRVAALLANEPEATNPLVLVYLNRLSDLLFVLARSANRQGRDDIAWRPGARAQL